MKQKVADLAAEKDTVELLRGQITDLKLEKSKLKEKVQELESTNSHLITNVMQQANAAYAQMDAACEKMVAGIQSKFEDSGDREKSKVILCDRRSRRTWRRRSQL